MPNIYKLTFTIFCFLVINSYVQAKQISPSQVGAEQLDQYIPLLTDKKVALVVNQTSRAQGKHLVDLLLEKHIKVERIFAPEHGFRGNQDAGKAIESGIDQTTGIAITSIYGKHKKPSSESLQGIDIIVFDIQDVGTRFYTYVSSMFYVMQAAAENNVQMIVLDRPNPNIEFIDGPMLEDEFRSFVGMLPTPILHGMTLGELAKMIVGENWLTIESSKPNFNYQLNLTVVPVAQYTRTDSYSLPIKPSPNLPNQQAIRLYPSLCLFEATAISIGRGTPFPFQVVGHNELHIGQFEFTPQSIEGAASNPKLKDKQLTGVDLRSSNISGFDLSVFQQWWTLFKANNQEFIVYPEFLDKLAGTNKLRKALQSNTSLKVIKQSWQVDLDKFKQQRQPYLLYP